MNLSSFGPSLASSLPSSFPPSVFLCQHFIYQKRLLSVYLVPGTDMNDKTQCWPGGGEGGVGEVLRTEQERAGRGVPNYLVEGVGSFLKGDEFQLSFEDEQVTFPVEEDGQEPEVGTWGGRRARGWQALGGTADSSELKHGTWVRREVRK